MFLSLLSIRSCSGGGNDFHSFDDIHEQYRRSSGSCAERC